MCQLKQRELGCLQTAEDPHKDRWGTLPMSHRTEPPYPIPQDSLTPSENPGPLYTLFLSSKKQTAVNLQYDTHVLSE